MTRRLSEVQAILGVVLLLAGSFTLAACDSNEDTIDVNTLIGTYTFTEWTFAPNATAISDANVLDTLVTAQTNLRFTSDNKFLLNYQFQGGAGGLFISGSFSVSGQQVSLNIDGSDDAARKKLLLPSQFTLTVVNNGAQLDGSISRDGVTLTEFSSRYAGIPPLDGVLMLQLRKL